MQFAAFGWLGLIKPVPDDNALTDVPFQLANGIYRPGRDCLKSRVKKYVWSGRSFELR
jgi:hypothetical protein